MGNVEAVAIERLSPFRKVALGTWSDPRDPQIYGSLVVRMETALGYLEEISRRTGIRVTVTHLVVKAIGQALVACPEANVLLRWGRPHRRRSVDVSVLVAVASAGAQDLSAVRVSDVDHKGLPQIAAELASAARIVRAGEDVGLETARRRMQRVPALLMSGVLRLVTFLAYTLNLDLRRLGIPKDPFGAAVVSSLGSLGLESAYVPLVGYSKAPIVVAAGAVVQAPVVDGGRLAVGQVMRLCATFDHRVIDGAHASVMAAAIRDVFERPWAYSGEEPAPEGAYGPAAVAPAAPPSAPSGADRARSYMRADSRARAARTGG
jgi:pyruvate dehydrogenase E2 component (dihydrolipoamide acetyltransferase)